jgi:hypothetical protein
MFLGNANDFITVDLGNMKTNNQVNTGGIAGPDHSSVSNPKFSRTTSTIFRVCCYVVLVGAITILSESCSYSITDHPFILGLVAIPITAVELWCRHRYH